jgi:aldehyde dehydrogenase (NAD+)
MVLGARHGEKGYFVQPTVFSNVNMTHQIAQEEIFGPVASIIKFMDEKEAISIANDTTYGLAAAVHTLDASQMARVTRRLRAGT